jgi:hypothetical protein
MPGNETSLNLWHKKICVKLQHNTYKTKPETLTRGHECCMSQALPIRSELTFNRQKCPVIIEATGRVFDKNNK